MRKVWWLINFNEKKFTKKQVAVAWFLLLLSQAPAVTGTNGIDVGCAKQSLLLDATNMCAEMDLEMLSKKRKQLQQVRKFEIFSFECDKTKNVFVQCLSDALDPMEYHESHELKEKKSRRNYSDPFWTRHLLKGVAFMNQIKVHIKSTKM